MQRLPAAHGGGCLIATAVNTGLAEDQRRSAATKRSQTRISCGVNQSLTGKKLRGRERTSGTTNICNPDLSGRIKRERDFFDYLTIR